MGDFLNALFEPDDLLEVRFLPSKRRLFVTASALPAMIDRLRQENDQGQNVYISANPRARKGGKAADVALARSVFADLEQIDAAAALERIRGAGLPRPTVLVISGHGIHAYWRLLLALTDMQAWKALQKQLAALLVGDSAVCDPPRVMRLPGFTNHKPPPAKCSLVEADPQRRYRVEDLLQQSNGSNRGIEAVETKPASAHSVVSVDSVDSVTSVHSVDSVTLLHGKEKDIAEAIRCTLPTKPGERHKLIFQFARALKGIPQVADLPAGALKPVMRRWHKAALAFIATQCFDESWADFVAAWRNVLYALGESPLDQVFEALQSMQPPAEVALYGSAKVRLLVALCAELQRLAGNSVFYLDCRAASRVLDVDPVSVWRWLKMLVADDLLIEVETGKPGRCTRWRWKGCPPAADPAPSDNGGKGK